MFNAFVGSVLGTLVLMWLSDRRDVWIPWMFGMTLVLVIVNLVVWVLHGMLFYKAGAVVPEKDKELA